MRRGLFRFWGEHLSKTVHGCNRGRFFLFCENPPGIVAGENLGVRTTDWGPSKIKNSRNEKVISDEVSQGDPIQGSKPG
mgnify:CR=1 FL=1